MSEPELCFLVFGAKGGTSLHVEQLSSVTFEVEPSVLTSHMITHSNVFKYQCERCPAKYKSKSALKVHYDRHDGNRTQQCEFCHEKFYTASVLIKHRRTHTGERPFVCKVCSKGFTGRHNLRVHMRVHGEYLIVKKNSENDVNNIKNPSK